MALRESATASASERSLLAAARLGDTQSFEALVEPHRRGLHLHCYRMTGSLTDADDMLQESLLKAWRRIDIFEDGAFRAWLFKIATNTCLNELAARRRTLFLATRRWSGGPPALAEIEHLQPYPDRLMDDAADPAARLDLKESVALAFIAVIQLLPPRQRAVLLLRDVIAWSAREVADALDCSVASVNSALQRARTTLRARFETGEPGTTVVSLSDLSEKRLLARFMDAWERCDFDELASLLQEDAILAMPPTPVTQSGLPHVSPTWLRGRAAIVDFLSAVPADGHLEQIRLVPVGSNRQPALAAFIAEPDDGGHQFYGLMVFSFEEEAISAITGFADSRLGDYFGLPSWLPSNSEKSRKNMAYDETLADRIREALAREKGVEEIKMMGGLCFMIAGHMALGIVGEELMVRVGPDEYERALSRAHAREMDFTGRSMKGFVFVGQAGFGTKRSLASWVAPATGFAKSLPPKQAKAGRARTRGE